jgi:cyanate lyase
MKNREESEKKSEKLRQHLIKKREELGMSYSELSELIFTNNKSEARKVLNFRNLTITNYLLICSALNINADETLKLYI